MPPLAKRRLTRRQALIGGAGLALGGLLLANDTHALTVEAHDVALPGLDRRLEGQRVVLLADFHRGPLVDEEWLHRCVERAMALQPHLVLLAGDFISMDAANIDSCGEALRRLEAPLGCYAVLGNHDHWEGADTVRAGLRRIGVELLENSHTRLGAGLYVAGVDDWWAGDPDPRAALAGIPAAADPLVMVHNPYRAEDWIDRRMTMLSGHTHGGQVNLPGAGLFHGDPSGRFLSGWVQLGPGRVYVNRGLGVVSVPVRVNAPPEITLLRLRAA